MNNTPPNSPSGEGSLPDFTSIIVHCDGDQSAFHRLRVKMVFESHTTTDSGQAALLFRCPVEVCRCEKTYAIGRSCKTGLPKIRRYSVRYPFRKSILARWIVPLLKATFLLVHAWIAYAALHEIAPAIF